jgi:selenide,water dikinase
MKRLVLLGGGHSHVEVLRRFGETPLPGVELTLVSPHPDSPYSGMLPGWIAGHYSREQCHVDLVRLARFANCRFVRTASNGINPEARLVFCENGESLPFDFVAVDTGTRSPAFDTAGALAYTLPVKPVERFIPAWEDICDRARQGLTPRRIVVVGGGAAGAEVLLSMQYRLRRAAPSAAVDFELVSDTESTLPSHNAKVQAIFQRVLEERGVKRHLGRAVERVDRGMLRLRGGGTLEADIVVWATGASAPLWPKSVGLATDARGFILVNDRLQCVSHPRVFAAGDIASIRDHPRPKSGVFAVRAGPPLAENLRRALLGKELLDWRPQRQALALIGTGDHYAVASRGDLALEGAWIWKWKDWIDRRFVTRYELP